MQVLANAIMVITLQYINVSNQHAAHPNLHNNTQQLYLNKAGIKLKEYHSQLSQPTDKRSS